MNFPKPVTFREASDIFEQMWGQTPEEKAWTLRLQRRALERHFSPAANMRRELRRMSYRSICRVYDALQNQPLEGEYDDGIPMTVWAEAVQAEKSAREAKYHPGFFSGRSKRARKK